LTGICDFGKKMLRDVSQQTTINKKVAMKFEKILACAVGAGLLTFAAGSARAIVIDDEVATVLNAQLRVNYTDSNGKIKSATVTSKDLITAIGDDFSENYSGDEIIAFDRSEVPDDAGSYDYELVDKHGADVLDLTSEDVIENEYDTLTDSEHEGKDSFKYVETGELNFLFASDGEFIDEEDNTLFFVQEGIPYTYTETGTAVTHNGTKEMITVTEKDGIDTEGFDFNVFDNGDNELPIAGVITQDGSGTLVGP
jgi:hypothetical protein